MRESHITGDRQRRGELAAAIQRRLNDYRAGVAFRESPQDIPRAGACKFPLPHSVNLGQRKLCCLNVRARLGAPRLTDYRQPT